MNSPWKSGQLLAFSGIDGATDYHFGLTLRTTNSGLEVKLPGPGSIQFPVTEAGELRGDWFRIGAVRGVLLDADHLLIEGAVDVTGLGPELQMVRAGLRSLIGSRHGFAADRLEANLDEAIAARRRWQDGLRLPATPAMTKALSQMKTMVYAPQGQLRHRFTTPDRWPHRGMWLWDSAFHAIGYRHVDVALARDLLEAVFDAQRTDGFVPIRSDPDASHATFTQPPVLALAVKCVDESQEDRDWLAQIYPKLSAYVRWDLANRDSDGAGLVEWLIEENVNCRSGESGMDNSPRFDAATRMDATDFNSFLAHECEILAEFARRLGLTDDAERWRAQYRRLCRLIEERLWSDRLQCYVDFDLERQQPSPVLAAAGFLPLLCGAAAPERAAALCRHLHDPRTFGTPLPVPSVAACDPGYARDMWRGPVWVNLNWLIARGLDRYSFHDEARRIRIATIREIERQHARYGTFFEFFDDQQAVDPPQLLRKGQLAPAVSPYHQVFFDYGWTATLYVDLYQCLRASTGISGRETHRRPHPRRGGPVRRRGARH